MRDPDHWLGDLMSADHPDLTRLTHLHGVDLRMGRVRFHGREWGTVVLGEHRDGPGTRDKGRNKLVVTTPKGAAFLTGFELHDQQGHSPAPPWCCSWRVLRKNRCRNMCSAEAWRGTGTVRSGYVDGRTAYYQLRSTRKDEEAKAPLVSEHLGRTMHFQGATLSDDRRTSRGHGMTEEIS